MDDSTTDTAGNDFVLTLADGQCEDGGLTADETRVARLLLHTRGYVILRNALPRFVYDEARASFAEIFADCSRSKEGDGWYQVGRETAAVFWERNRRWRIFPKLRGVFADPRLIANPTVMPLLRAGLGDGLFCKFVSTDTCLAGAEMQSPHRELGAGRTWEPCAYVVNVPLGPCGLRDGPLEVWPGSGHLWRNETLEELGLDTDIQDGRNPECEQFSRLFPSRRLLLEPGDILIRDPGMLHRGTVNQTSTPRSMMTICYFREGHWHDYGEAAFNLDRAMWNALDEELRPLFAYVFDP